MAEIIHVEATIEMDGVLHLSNLPLKRGQQIELSIRLAPMQDRAIGLTAEQLLSSEAVGIWEDRSDIVDSSEFARQLREQAQHRH